MVVLCRLVLLSFAFAVTLVILDDCNDVVCGWDGGGGGAGAEHAFRFLAISRNAGEPKGTE